ncbi:MAG: hypothetical protein KJ058_08040 [Thermoanaerobaculia bacterium]|nr:hypothetical protein [Thermoanaerobaculia bacterium]
MSAPAPEGRAATLAAAERLLVLLVVLHSAGIGVALLAFPRWAAGFGGWGEAGPLFFLRQGGVFHLVVAFGYLQEYLRHRGVTLLVAAKSAACLFLLGVTLAGETAWSVPLSGVADGGMAVAALLLHRARRRAERLSSATG